jgi:hypothetical protein
MTVTQPPMTWRAVDGKSFLSAGHVGSRNLDGQIVDILSVYFSGKTSLIETQLPTRHGIFYGWSR